MAALASANYSHKSILHNWPLLHKHSLGEHELDEETALPLHVSIKIKVLGLKSLFALDPASRIQVDQLQEPCGAQWRENNRQELHAAS